MQLEYFDGTKIGQLVNSKEISPVEIIQYFADRIEKRNPTVNAFTYTKIDEALEDAKSLEHKIMKDEYVGPFAGVPVGLKDFLPSKKGWTNSHGGVKHLICVDTEDSTFYASAKALGAIAIGKTNAPAFGFSGCCQNTLYGTTCNPFDTNRTSGGSSGGTAAAVADGLIAFGEGGDAGGSIRIPSGWCNLFGFKPSVGTVPSYCRPDGWAATHPYCFNGVLSKSVRDSALMLNNMAQYNPKDPISLPINSNKDFLELMNNSIKEMKIGLTYDFDMYEVDERIKKIIESTAKLLEEAGAYVDIVHFNFKHTVDEIMYCWCWAISVDTALDLAMWKENGLDLVKDYREELPEDFIKFNEIASKASIFDMREFNEIRTDILDNFENVFTNFNAIISPTAICPPMLNSDNGRCLKVNDKILNPELNFISFAETPLANFVGYPSASIPAGLIDSKLPSGLQVICPKYKDEDIFVIARTLEEVQPWYSNYALALNRII